jgi:hypothetical protein
VRGRAHAWARDPGRQSQAPRCRSTQLDSFKGICRVFRKIHIRKLARGDAALRYKCTRADFCHKPYRRPLLCNGRAGGPDTEDVMSEAAREWLGRHGWELVLIVAAAVVGKLDHLW